MLGVSKEVLNKLAQQKVSHSWLAEIMAIEDQQKQDEAEWRLAKWIQEKAKEMYPQAEFVERIVRNALPMLMERPAIVTLLKKEEDLYQALPMVEDAQEAAAIAAMDVMYVENQEVQQAAEMLQKIQEGELTPNLQEIIP